MKNTISSFSSQQLTVAIDSVIQTRKTLKVLGDLDSPIDIPNDFNQRIDDAIKVANWAPFHYPANAVHRQGAMDSVVPWRFYALSQAVCLELGHCLTESSSVGVTKEANIVRMLSACGGLVMVTWLPDPRVDDPDQSDKKRSARQTVRDEHIAAAGAATQNLLLAAEAREMQIYWSSGGILQSASCFNLCGIPERQKLMGAIFMFPQHHQMETVSGKLRDKRGEKDSWMSWVKINKSHVSHPIT